MELLTQARRLANCSAPRLESRPVSKKHPRAGELGFVNIVHGKEVNSHEEAVHQPGSRGVRAGG